ncbi:hypothetical protein E3C22_23810 [Jiella endophytica]|uniref:Uncharacterized protein n=1 Tax=Jiella endophytica TaxID=2558362 RepID=A0A4Y8R8Y4_9HYPH|nr:hypothetical protein [Jiella endophytica]TFF17685.1 hypothetical protein E3C22_23810 [Jiella endophytica]
MKAARSPLAVWFGTLAASLVGLVASMPGPTFGKDAGVAALYPPWWSQEEVLRSAGSAGDLIDTGGWSSVAILVFKDEDLPRRLRESGALMVMNARPFGCFTLR